MMHRVRESPIADKETSMLDMECATGVGAVVGGVVQVGGATYGGGVPPQARVPTQNEVQKSRQAPELGQARFSNRHMLSPVAVGALGRGGPQSETLVLEREMAKFPECRPNSNGPVSPGLFSNKTPEVWVVNQF